MKIKISDVLLSELVEDFADAVVASRMKRIMNDKTIHSNEGDQEYYDALKDAARLIYEHHSTPE